MAGRAAFSLLLLLSLLSGSAPEPQVASCRGMTITQQWDGGYGMDVPLLFKKTVESYTVELKFEHRLSNLECWNVIMSTSDNQTYHLKNTEWGGHHEAGGKEKLHFVVTYYQPSYLTSIEFFGDQLC